MNDREAPPRDGRELSPRVKLAVELGPLLAFFGTYFIAKRSLGDTTGMIWATGVFIAATLAAMAVSYSVERRIPPMTLVTGAIVLVMGTLTIVLADETFIKRKPTLVSGVAGLTLLGGLAAGRSLVKPMLGAALELDEQGWRKLTLRWGLFFLAIAALNEIVWRRMSTDAWITFKTFGILPLTFVFLLFQGPLIERHRLDRDEAAGNG
ncbi:MAG: septation protein A [Planctomycetota bacterium]